MTRAGRFVLLLMTAVGGLACHAREDLSKGRDGGGGTAGMGGAGAGGIGGAGGVQGPIVGMPLGTFDTGLDGFSLDTSAMTALIFGGNGNQTNLGADTTPPPRA